MLKIAIIATLGSLTMAGIGGLVRIYRLNHVVPKQKGTFSIQYGSYDMYMRQVKKPVKIDELANSKIMSDLNDRLTKVLNEKDWDAARNIYASIIKGLLLDHYVSKANVEISFGNIVNNDNIQTVKLRKPECSFGDRIMELFDKPELYRITFTLGEDNKIISIQEKNRYNDIMWEYYFSPKSLR